jgi:hypothetical protein
MSIAALQSSAAAAPKGQREVDQVRQIGSSHGGKVLARQLSGVRHHITITLSMDADSPQLRAMLRAIEFAIRGQFDRGRRLQAMTQFVAKSRLIDVHVRCLD